ncbi:hypothetical protein APUTEX25_004997, partial [Auxenochlorella protothecoides]
IRYTTPRRCELINRMASLAFRTLPFVSLTNSTRAIPQRIAHNHRFPPRPRHIAMSSISREVIATENAPGAVGAYSQAIKANGFVYISGQVPLVPGVSCILWVSAPGRGGVSVQVNAVYGKYFPVDPPARAAYAVRDLPLGAKVEIEAVALAP